MYDALTGRFTFACPVRGETRVVLSAFRVAAARTQRVLAGGIVGALLLRLAFVFAGLALIAAVHDLLVVFGVVLLVAGVRMARRRDDAAA